MERSQAVDLLKDNGGNSPGSSGNNGGNSPLNVPLHTGVLSGASTTEEVMLDDERAAGQHRPSSESPARIGNYNEDEDSADMPNTGGLD